MTELKVSFSRLLKWTERDCRDYLERIRWPDGPVCPRCGAPGPYRIARRSKTKNKVQHLYSCRNCKRQFSATVGTIFEGSKMPLRKWFSAIYLMCAFKRGISAYEIHVQTRMSYRSAWLICHRIREALDDGRYVLEVGE